MVCDRKRAFGVKLALFDKCEFGSNIMNHESPVNEVTRRIISRSVVHWKGFKLSEVCAVEYKKAKVSSNIIC